MSVLTAPPLAAPRAPNATRLAAGAPRTRLLAALVAAGLLAAVAGGVALGAPGAAARAAADPDLAHLLRAMALVKGTLVVLAALAVGWRLRRPAPALFAAGYVALVWAMGAAVGAMWQLAAVGQSAVLLHAAGAALLVLAWRDREFFPVPEARAR